MVHFYAMVTELIGDTSSQRWRLLYTITLMRLVKVIEKCFKDFHFIHSPFLFNCFFKAFDKSIISSTAMPLHWRIVVELRGPWLGILWTSKNRSLNQSSHRCNLLVILSEMLLANITGRGFK